VVRWLLLQLTVCEGVMGPVASGRGQSVSGQTGQSIGQLNMSSVVHGWSDTPLQMPDVCVRV